MECLKECREKYLNSQSAAVYGRLKANFNKIEAAEEKFAKGFVEFNELEFRQLMMDINSKSVLTLQNIVNSMILYLKFLVKEGEISKITESRHPAHGYIKYEKLSEFTNDENLFFEQNELDCMVRLADNAQDSLLLKLLFEGFSRENQLIELRELRIEDVDIPNKRVYIRRRDMWLDVDDLTIQRCELAINQRYYYSIPTNSGVSRKYELNKTKYVFRGTKRDGGMISYRNLSQRIFRLTDQQEKSQLFTATNIVYNGQIALYNRKIEAGLECIEARKVVLQTFGFDMNQSSLYYLKKRIERFQQMQEEMYEFVE